MPVGGLDVAEGEAADRGRPLGAEEDQQAGQAVLGLKAIVVEQPSGLLPAGFGVDHAGRATPFDGREVQGGDLVPACPADEVAGVGAVTGLRLARPLAGTALDATRSALEGKPWLLPLPAIS